MSEIALAMVPAHGTKDAWKMARPAGCRDDEPLAASGCPTRAAPHRYGGAAVRRSSVSAYHGE